MISNQRIIEAIAKTAYLNPYMYAKSPKEHESYNKALSDLKKELKL